MKPLKCLILLSTLSTTLCGCNNNKTKIFRNGDYFLNNENYPYLKGDIQTIENLISTEIPFIVYLSSDTCSHCRNFSPILLDWVNDTHSLVVNINSNEAYDIDAHFNNLFSITNNSGKKQLAYPTLGIVKSKNTFNIVDNDRYMQLKRPFFNYMNKTYESSNIYFSKGTFEGATTNRKFTYISTNKNTENIYKGKLLSYVNSTSKDVIISDYNVSALKISLLNVNNENKNYLTNSLEINSETSNDSLINYF